MEYIFVKDIKKKNTRVDIWIEVSKGIDDFFLPSKHFFAEYDFPVESIPDEILSLPLLMNVIPLSWIIDCTVWIEKIDKKFYRCLPYLKQGFQEMYPHSRLGGTLIPAKFCENSYDAKCAAIQLFTGGVDATTTFIRHRNERPILLNTYGWFENEICENFVCETDCKSTKEFADKQGVNSCFSRSNFGKFIRADMVNRAMRGRFHNSWWFGFQHSMAFIGLAAPAAYYYGAEKVYIASSYTFRKRILCASDPTTDGQVEFASCQVIHDGYELSRQKKIEKIVEYQKQTKETLNLRVCSFNDHNCCRCEKCFRTMLGLVAEGGDVTKYGFTLKRSLYEEVREHLENEVQFLDADHIVFWQEIITRMQENYDNVFDKDVADFLRDYDFAREKKRGLWRYYRRNFFSILKRKINGLLTKGN